MERKGAIHLLVGLVVVEMICVGASAESFTIADSVAEFSGTQGTNGWLYGYFDGPFGSSDFQQMTEFTGANWYVRRQGDLSGTFWTTLGAAWGHPNGPKTSGGRSPAEQWAVRRWISEVTGPITITGVVAKVNTNGGDGTTESILINGVSIYSQFVQWNDSVGFDYLVNANVSVGDTIDFVIRPGADDGSDATKFVAIITSPVPEPSSLLTLCSGCLGFAAYRRRERARSSA